MKEVILGQHEQIARSLDVNKQVNVAGEFDSIVLAGLGGSGHPGDLLNALSVCRVPLFVHRDYDLPTDALAKVGFKRPLVIASSYSGNTEETMTAYKAARDNNFPLIVSSSGGTLQQWAEKDDVPFITIDFPDMQPRHTLLAAFTGIYTALRNSGLVDNIDDQLTSAAEALAEKTAGLETAAQALVEKIAGKVPVYYATDQLGFAAKNFKIQTNENAKYPAFWHTFPELNHNELLGFSMLKETNHPNRFFVLMLRDSSDHPRNATRINITRELYENWGITVDEFVSRGNSLPEKIFYTTTFGLWVTYLLALKQNVDPVSVGGVESFKSKLQDIAGPL